MKIEKNLQVTNVVEVEDVKGHIDGELCSEIEMINTHLYTDGEFVKTEMRNEEKIDNYYIGRKKYKAHLSELTRKRVFLSNATYIIILTLSREWITINGAAGWFDVIEDVEIYINDRKDKRAFKEAKKVVEEISLKYHSKTVLHKFSKDSDFEEADKNVFTLKK